MTELKKTLKKVLNRLDLDSLYWLSRIGYLKEVGWFRSRRDGAPVDASGHPVPWMTYPAVAFLVPRIDPSWSVFEYSCGNSTLWWAERVSKLVSCEHDRVWYEKIRPRLPKHVELMHVDLVYGGEYGRKILDYDSVFDIIVIDGRDRINCARNCLTALKKSGIIVWDNSDRQCYQDGYDFLVANGFRRIDFDGMGPLSTYGWSTSIFYRDGNCLGI